MPKPRRTRTYRPGRRALAALAATGVLALAACGSASHPKATTSTAPETTDAAIARFLDTYVDPDGRVVRHDQGGDTVSEGQAYAMLLAEAGDRPGTARAVWTWTAAHLLRPDGLVSYRETAGGQVDRDSAGDADLLLAWALVRYAGPDASALHAAGDRLAAAVLAHETVRTAKGTPVLVAGNWATSSPAVVDPSYWAPVAMRALAAATHQPAWTSAADGVPVLAARLAGGEHLLPPDWAAFDGTTLTPRKDPGGGSPASYGLDAERLVVWLGTGCSSQGRQVAAAWAPRLGGPADASARSLQGTVTDHDRAPLAAVAVAAADSAAGNQAGLRSALALADADSARYPTYYGAAWDALGHVLLTTHRLTSC
ncbi:MAG TPA: glycosyl hydrolase family 8 [Mycobacteriales bacterium]